MVPAGMADVETAVMKQLKTNLVREDFKKALFTQWCYIYAFLRR